MSQDEVSESLLNDNMFELSLTSHHGIKLSLTRFRQILVRAEGEKIFKYAKVHVCFNNLSNNIRAHATMIN